MSYSLIDDDHIDDQETINVGNLIIDLEDDLEKEKIKNEQANNNTTNIDNKNTSKRNNNSSGNKVMNAPSSVSASVSAAATASIAPSLSLASSTSAPSQSSTSSAAPLPSSASYAHLAATKGNNTNLAHELTRSSASSNKLNQKAATVKHSIASNNQNNSTSLGNGGNLVTASVNNGHMTSRTVFKSSADERGELKMKITRETKPGKSEHKIVTSPNQKSPISSSNIIGTTAQTSGNSIIQASNYEDTCVSDNMSGPSQASSSISSTKECGTSTSVGTITEPDCLGPCEPGTSVTLEGIVWQETDGGILVVNVTWRGKTYVGALLDCTKHDWAPPRLCDSPASDIDSKTNKSVRAKRIVTRSNGIGLDDKNLLQTTGKLRNGKGRRIPPTNDPPSYSKKQRDSSDKPSSELTAQSEANNPGGNQFSASDSEVGNAQTSSEAAQAPSNQDQLLTSNTTGPESPTLIGCSEPNCSKKYRNINGLMYHQAHAHAGDQDTSTSQDGSCTSSTKDRELTQSKNEAFNEPKPCVDEQTSDSMHDSTSRDPKESSFDIKLHQGQKRERTPSPHTSMKMSKMLMDSTPTKIKAQQNPSTPKISTKVIESERRHSSTQNELNLSRGGDSGRRSPGAIIKHPTDINALGASSSYNAHLSSRPTPSGSKLSTLSPLPATTEEGMKPSGTSTGPPPAPHQANCYFNSAFLTNSFNPYPFPPYHLPRQMYDQIAPPTPTTNAALLSRFMSNFRAPPPPDSPSRLLSPSMVKNLPFPPFKIDPGSLPPPVPTSQIGNPTIPNLSPMANPPPITSGSPHLRMPSQGDPLMPPSSQHPPFLPTVGGINLGLGLPGPANSLGPLGGPQVPSLVDDPMKQFPRRFN